MQNNWQEKLQEEFPFMKQNPVEEEKNLYRHYGCECSGGWYDILHDCCKKITERYEEAGVPIDFVPAQIKEKFGTLRFYYGYEDAPCGIAAFDNLGTGTSIRPVPGINGEDNEDKIKLRRDIAAIVREAEEKSAHTCEMCGAEGSLKKVYPGRVDTFCDKCAAKTLERIEEKRKARRELSAQEYLEKYVKTVPLN